jgi:hypothetical protein
MGALLLAAAMFGFEWYGVAGVPGRSRLTSSENAWHALILVRWLMLLTIVVAVGALPLHATQRGHGAKTNTGWPVMVLGGTTALVLVYRVLIAVPSADRVVDQKLGAIVGILCALAVAFGGWETMKGERAITRGFANGVTADDPPPGLGVLSAAPRQDAARAPDAPFAARRRNRLARRRN